MPIDLFFYGAKVPDQNIICGVYTYSLSILWKMLYIPLMGIPFGRKWLAISFSSILIMIMMMMLHSDINQYNNIKTDVVIST